VRTAFLFAAVAAIAFFVTIDIPARPDAPFHADFEPAVQAETLHLTLRAPTVPERIRAL
jgi:hypothetical protein